MTSPQKIIVFGQDQTLINTRAWVLKGAGDEVATTTSLEEVAGLNGTDTVELLILCHTLSSDQISSAIELAHADRLEPKKLLLLTSSNTQPFEASYPTLDALSGPKGFVEAVQKLLASPSE